MKTIHLITFTSETHKGTITEKHTELLDRLKEEYDVNLINIRNIDRLTEKDFKLIFIASGSVEHTIINNYEHLPHPLFLLIDGYNNSLSAAMELKAWANSQSIKANILYAGNEDIIEQINTLYRIHTSLNNIKGKKIGVIGTPSQWLVSSSVNYLLAQRRWGVEYIDISTDEVIDEYKNTNNDEVGELAAEIAARAEMCIEATPDDLLKDLRMYKAIKSVIEKYKLDAITINAYKIFEQIKTSCCVALSMLNNEGIPAISEGDLQSVFTAMAIKELTGETAFSGNVSKIVPDENNVMLAGCTISTDITDSYIIRSHYESGVSVAIQGTINPGQEVTIVKCGGESLDEYFVSKGETVPFEQDERFCRTQIMVNMKNPVSYFTSNPIGNHHLLIKNDYSKLIKCFFKYTNSKRVK